MAEALARRRTGERFELFSAGVQPWNDLHPMARRLMAERGKTLAGHFPKAVATFRTMSVDYVVTIGQRAMRQCPDLPGNSRRIHWDIDDPADADGTPGSEEAFRGALAGIEQRLDGLLETAGRLPTARQLHLRRGISTYVTAPRPFDLASDLPAVVEAGFDGIELALATRDDLTSWESRDSRNLLRRAAGDCGVHIWSIHAPHYSPNDISSNDPVLRWNTVAVLKRTLDLAADLGALVVPFHAGLPPEAVRSGLFSKAAFLESLPQISDHALALPCVAGWENAPLRWAAFSPQEMVDAVLSFPAEGLGVVLDTGHANHYAGSAAAFLPAIGPRLRGWHFDDNAGQGDDHLLPYRGTVPWDEVAQLCVAAGYAGQLMLEVNPRGLELRPFLTAAATAAARLAGDCARTVRAQPAGDWLG